MLTLKKKFAAVALAAGIGAGGLTAASPAMAAPPDMPIAETAATITWTVTDRDQRKCKSKVSAKQEQLVSTGARVKYVNMCTYISDKGRPLGKITYVR